MRRIILYFSSEPIHMDLKQVTLTHVFVAPDTLQQHVV